MSDRSEPKQEHPSTYMVQDRSNQQELDRLRIQDQMLTASMGGVLPEQPEPEQLKSVLDVACGTGGWLIEAAKRYPTMTRLIGVDISERMITYARAQADLQGVGDRVEFRTMDALRMLEFPTSSFDLVNHRCGGSFLRTLDWPKLLQEYIRVSKPGGVIRITEFDIITQSSSPAHLRLSALGQEALYHSGHLFTATHDGVTSQLARLLDQFSIQNIQTRSYALEYQANTPGGQNFIEDMKHLYRTVLPFLRKWTRVPKDYEAIYQQMLDEMQQPDFVATFPLLCAWGNAPGKKGRG